MIIRGSNSIGTYGGNNTGYVGIGTSNPMAKLHLGPNCITEQCSDNTAAGGWRTWSQDGLFICSQTDNMYVGMKDEGEDRQDAVIAWGDNAESDDIIKGPDVLRFIFNEYCFDPNPHPIATSPDGLEVMRIMPLGFVGIGANKFYNSGSVLQPGARLRHRWCSHQRHLSNDIEVGD